MENVNMVALTWRMFLPRSLHDPGTRLLGRLQTPGARILTRRAPAAAAAMATGR